MTTAAGSHSGGVASLPSLAVTGVTGTVGRLTAEALAAEGVPFRMLARDPARAPRLPATAVLQTAYADADAARSALDGVAVLFMVSAAENEKRLAEQVTFIDAAAAAGVGHIVYTSFFRAAPDATFIMARDDYATEQRIRETGMTFTFLRDNLYLDFVEGMVGEDDVIRGPAGNGRAAMVARADVARVAARVLQEADSHADVTYDLTGPEELTMSEVAEVLSSRLGRAISFHNETLVEAYESRKRWKAQQWQYDAWISNYAAIAAGELAGVTDDVQRVTGRQPLSLSQFLESRPL